MWFAKATMTFGSELFDLFRFGFGAPAINADVGDPGALTTIIDLIVQGKRMAFSKVSDLTTIGLYEAHHNNKLFEHVGLMVWMHYEGNQGSFLQHGVHFENVLIEKFQPRAYINRETALDTVWIMADWANRIGGHGRVIPPSQVIK